MTMRIRYLLICLLPVSALAGPEAPCPSTAESLPLGAAFQEVLVRNEDAELRRQALREWFHSPEFNVRDEMSEYSRDYRAFDPLGEIETADMRHHARRLLAGEDGGSLETVSHSLVSD
jgi:hypothetical protein